MAQDDVTERKVGVRLNVTPKRDPKTKKIVGEDAHYAITLPEYPKECIVLEGHVDQLIEELTALRKTRLKRK